ncbi:MAG: hypothetical protein ACI81R_003686 [Bradymonadia bacterium]|jgi:hypothetical protein
MVPTHSIAYAEMGSSRSGCASHARSMTAMRLLAILALTLATLLPGSAFAYDLPGFDLKLGVRGGAGFSLVTEPSGTDAYPDIPYTDYYGFGAAFGLAAHVRILSIISFETGWIRSWDSVRGTIELDDVLAANGSRRERQELVQHISARRDHIPLILQFAIPIGVARPYLSVGVDLTISRGNRSYEVEAGDNDVPGVRDGNLASDPSLVSQWGSSPTAQNALNGRINRSSGDEVNTGIIVGLGVDIALEKIEMPVEFRAILYPGTGSTLADRGAFDEGPAYNDNWSAQLFILFGLDYVLF